MGGELISERFAEEIVSAGRTAAGDELRSVTYFDIDDYEQLYIRSDLEQTADLDAFVATERLGFRSQLTYEGTELGKYLFTVRAFEYGFLTRAIVGEHGVFVTTDEMDMEMFEEVTAAIRGVLREHLEYAEDD